MISREIPWKMPLVTCVFFAYTFAIRLVCFRKIQVTRDILTLYSTGFFRLVLKGEGGGGHKAPAAFFSETVKATAIIIFTLTN